LICYSLSFIIWLKHLIGKTEYDASAKHNLRIINRTKLLLVMNIAVTGSSGLVGRNLYKHFNKPGIKLIKIDRRALYRDSEQLLEYIEHADVIIHLAGAPVFQLWTGKNKKIIRDSRIITSENLFSALKKSKKKPKLVMFSSGVSIYSSDGRHDEESKDFSNGFLAELIMEWESIANRIREMGIRTVVMRFGVVLGRGGGALEIMYTPFKLGLGAIIGNGKQKVSFIHINDLCRAIDYLINDSDYSGIVNFASPESSTNRKFAGELAKALRRPLFLRVPDFAVRTVLGEVSVLILSGEDVEPGILIREGFKFKFPGITAALKDLF
jgi:uncharacterized protein